MLSAIRVPPRVRSSASQIERWISRGASCRRPMTRTRIPSSINSSVCLRTASSIRPKSPATSSSERRQFSWLKTYSERTSIPRSGAMRTTGRIASTPWTWPAMGGSPRAAAQRRLPSMMIATCRGCSRSGSAPDLHHFSFFVLGPGVDRVDEAIGQALERVELAPLFIFGDGTFAQGALEVVSRLATVSPHFDPTILGATAHLLDHLASTLLGQRWDVKPDDRPVNVRHEPDIALEDRSLHPGLARGGPVP